MNSFPATMHEQAMAATVATQIATKARVRQKIQTALCQEGVWRWNVVNDTDAALTVQVLMELPAGYTLQRTDNDATRTILCSPFASGAVGYKLPAFSYVLFPHNITTE